jgi:hypothetical protein
MSMGLDCLLQLERGWLANCGDTAAATVATAAAAGQVVVAAAATVLVGACV